MADEDEGEAIRVFVRMRPLNRRELEEKQVISWNYNETSMIEDTPNGQRVYAYDHCFGLDDNNEKTYEIVGKPVVLKAMEGYNGTVFTCNHFFLHKCNSMTHVNFFFIRIRWTNWQWQDLDNER